VPVIAMRTLAFLLTSWVLAACGGVATGTGPSSGSPDGGGSDASSGDSAVPAQHRPNPVPCAQAPLPPEPTIPDAGLAPSEHFDCRHHADCTAQPRGRCVYAPPDPPTDPGGTRCLYDVCQNDTDCPQASLCQCGALANTCLAGGCRVDSDCGAGGYCSPTVDLCGVAVAGYYCHRPTDACIVDSDCAGLPERCVADTSGTWKCRPVGCLMAGESR
jgi:hypothetical protein